MRSTGIVRKVDSLGRIVVPIGLRRFMEVDLKDDIEMFVEGNTIVLQKYVPACVFCGDGTGIEVYKEKNICANCMKDFRV